MTTPEEKQRVQRNVASYLAMCKATLVRFTNLAESYREHGPDYLYREALQKVAEYRRIVQDLGGEDGELGAGVPSPVNPPAPSHSQASEPSNTDEEPKEH